MSSLRHIGIVVTDIDIDKEVWIKGLNFQVVSDHVEMGKEIEELIGEEGAKLRSLKLRPQKGEVLVELIQFHFPPSVERRNNHIVNNLGITHIALTVSSLNELLDNLMHYGVRSIGRITRSKNGRTKGVYVATSNGVLLELVEEL